MPGTLTNLELAGLRVDQDQQLDAQCVIWRDTDTGVIDKNTGQFMGASTVTLYEGLCALQPILSRRDRFDVHGEQQIYQNQYRLTVPWDAFGIRIGDLVRVTDAHDVDLELKDMVIKDVLLVSDVTARRFTVIDITE